MAYSIKDFLETRASGDPSFSPDGSHVAYLSNSTGTSQVFLVAVEGGEPEQLTNFDDSISFVRFSPVEETLIFGKAEDGNEQTQLYLLNLDTRIVTDLTAQPAARHDFGAWSSDGNYICFSSNERNGKDFDVYTLDVHTKERRCILDTGGWNAAEGFSPKGTYVTARRKDSSANTDLVLIHLGTGSIEHLTPHEGSVFYMGASWLPDESAFFLIQDAGREFNGLARYSLAKRSIEYVYTPDWDIEDFTIDRNGTNIAVIVNEEGYKHVSLHDAHTFETRTYRFPAGNIYRVRFSESGSLVTFVLGDSRRTMDVWVLDLETGVSRQLTYSTQGVPPEAMVEPELIRYDSFDGLSIPAFMYLPDGVEPGARLPVVIDIHGGPESQYLSVYQPFTQYLVHHGYAVVAPNVRGSTGYGKTYQALDDVEKRLDSVKDIVALRDYLADRPDIDAGRIALSGASYGGFMVLACLAFHPEYWAAGIDTLGIANFVTFLENTAPYRRAVREAEYGSLEHDKELLERISPIHAIEKVRAPLLVIHGTNDPRVPLSEAEQVVEKLRMLGRQVQLLVYSDEGHGIAKLKNRLDAYPKIVEFLDTALR